MNKLKYILLVLSAAVLFSACDTDDTNEGYNGYFSTDISNSYIRLSQTQPGDLKVKITSNLDWEVAFDAAWLNVSADKGNGDKEIIFGFGENKTGETLRTKVSFIGKHDGKSMIMKEYDFIFPTKQEQISGEAPYSWLDLPAVVTNENTQYVAHFADVEGTDYRNYSMLYDKKEHIAYWIAYPVHAFYLNPVVDRREKWQYDPIVAQSDQVNLKSSYGELDGFFYTRGHQVASSDRVVSPEMNDQTFFYTNMTPQIAGFNGDVWSKYERWVQTQAVADTLYVVTGAILKTPGGNETVRYIKDTAIPNYYYKVMIKHKGDGFTGIGFWFKHETNLDNVSLKYAKSVREMEQLTGFDFFTNVPKDKQEAMETAYTASDWGL